ncbi:MAG: universal stress protein, partial [Gemmataceae bacterium]|nr:universal stress protein [Gemmataceae bacterium]
MPVGSASFGEMAHHMLTRVEELQRQLTAEAQSYLEQVADRVRGQGVKVGTELVIEEQAGVGILNAAKPPVELIALATHGRRGLSRLLLGSVADKVIRGATVPVFVQPPAVA